ncbi:MAG: type II toxin-antitoxin system mRNA interferase toxin, RelE/StbE family [Patescibacteria group bacterium]
MEVSFSPTFVRMLEALPGSLQEEALEKIELFKCEENHRLLKIHKLSGRLRGRYSFSVNYKMRVVFIYVREKQRTACLLAIGDHDIYD